MVDEARPSIPSAGKKHLSRRGRQILLQAVAGMIILVCGVVIGWGAAVLNLKDKMMLQPGPRPPTREVVEDMAARYNLTDEQAKKVEAAFGKRRQAIQTIFKEFRSKSEAEFQKLSADIKQILTPEQYAHWEQDFERRRRPPPWERGPGRPGERGGPGRGRPGRRGGFGDGGPRGDFGGGGPGRGFHDRDRDMRGPKPPEPNMPPPPSVPEANAPAGE
jgi:Spy/CpxP family protein refolding chaperone